MPSPLMTPGQAREILRRIFFNPAVRPTAATLDKIEKALPGVVTAFGAALLSEIAASGITGALQESSPQKTADTLRLKMKNVKPMKVSDILRQHIQKTAIAMSGTGAAGAALGRGSSMTTKPQDMLEWVLELKKRGRIKNSKSPFLEVQEPSMTAN